MQTVKRKRKILHSLKQKTQHFHVAFSFCGRRGIRTPDPLGVNQVL